MELRVPAGSTLDSLFEVGTMQLGGEHAVTYDPTDDQLRQAVDAMGKGWIEFVILASDDDVFVQAAGDGDGPYQLQRCEGDPDAMRQAVGHVDRAAVLATVLAFRAGDRSWEDAHEWVPLGDGRPPRKEGGFLKKLFGKG